MNISSTTTDLGNKIDDMKKQMEADAEKDQLAKQIEVLREQIANDQESLDDLRDKMANLVCPYKVGQCIVNTDRKKVIYAIVDIHRHKCNSYDFELTCRRITKDGLSKFTNMITIYSYDRYEVVETHKEASDDA